ncbi:MAG: hypothetical protein ACRDKZ_01930 [Actinomycetota bacterium]
MGKKARKKSKSARMRAQQKAKRARVRRAEQAVEKLFDDLMDPEVPSGEAAEALLRHSPERPSFDFAFLVCRGESLERGRALSAALLESDPESLTSLTFASSAASHGEDFAREIELLERAIQISDLEPVNRVHTAALVRGQRPEAFAKIGSLMRANPTDEDWQLMHQWALQCAQERRSAPSGTTCPCGSEKPYDLCCRPTDETALSRFSDRSVLEELARQLSSYSTRPKLQRHVRSARTDWFGDRLPSTTGPEQGLFWEWTWGRPLVDGDDDDDRDCILGHFADDPLTDDALRSAAEDWLGFGRFGLWQLDPSAPGPGVELLDLVTGIRICTAPGDSLLEGAAPWTVLLGHAVPIDGVWHLGDSVVLSPSEGEELALQVHAMAAIVFRELGLPRREVDALIDALPSRALGVAMDESEPLPEELGRVFSHVLSVALPDFIEWVDERRQAPPGLTNTDGEPLSLITAEIEVADRAALLERFRSHPDFDVHDDGEAAWLGKVMPQAQVETSMAQLHAQLKASGVDPAEIVLPEGPQRWVRATLTPHDDGLRVQVNSTERLDALVELLSELGVAPKVTSRVALDPREDLPWDEAAPTTESRGMSAEAYAAWAQGWLNEEVPALSGQTPREAAQSPSGKVLLEALLRDFEHRAALSMARGGIGPDVGWLRNELSMT